MLEQFSREWIEIGALVVAIVVAWTELRAGNAVEKSAEGQLYAVQATVISLSIYIAKKWPQQVAGTLVLGGKFDAIKHHH